MARLENAIVTIVDVFREYSAKEGKKGQLNKMELGKLLDEEIKSPELQGKISAADIEEAMEALDKNKDDAINFREFCRCVFVITRAYYREKHGRGKRGKEGAEA